MAEGLYVPAHADLDVPEQRIVEAAALLPPAAAVTGWAACRLHGSNFHDGLEPDGTTRIPVPLAVGTRGGVWSDPRVSVHFAALATSDWSLVQGVRTVNAIRATYDEMRRRRDLREAVVSLEMMAAARLVSIEQMREYAAARRGSHGIRTVREATALACEHSRSPNEARLRLVAELDAGFPRLLVNCLIFDRSGRLLGEADLFDVLAGLVIEFDGAEHLKITRRGRDVLKEEDLRACKLEVLRVTGPQLRERQQLVARLHAARGRALFLPPADRPWVAVPRKDVLHERLLEQESLGRLMQKWGLDGVGA